MNVTYTGMLAPQSDEADESLWVAELERTKQIDRLESVMRDMPQADIDTSHTFGPGFYARTIVVPEGCTLVGKVHATEHIFMLTKGEMTLVTEDGKQRVAAPFQCVSRPGLKRAGYAHTECVCTNVHITEQTDLLQLEADLILPEGDTKWLG